MNQLAFTPNEHEELSDLVRAGARGMALGREIRLSHAIRFQLSGLAHIRTQDGHQKAFATRMAESFLLRTVR